MLNQTNINIPKKYHHMIKEIYCDCDGYWLITNRGFIDSDMGTHGLHCETVKELLISLKQLVKE